MELQAQSGACNRKHNSEIVIRWLASRRSHICCTLSNDLQSEGRLLCHTSWTSVLSSLQNTRIHRQTIWMDVHWGHTLSVFWSVSSVQRGTKTNYTTHFAIDVHGNWRLHVYWYVVHQVHVASWQHFYKLTESQKLTVPLVSTCTVTLYRVYAAGKLTFGTALIFPKFHARFFWKIQIHKSITLLFPASPLLQLVDSVNMWRDNLNMQNGSLQR